MRAQLANWFLNGPGPDDNTLGWMVGMMVWWRMLASSALILIPFFAAFAFYLAVDPVWGVIAAYFLGSWSGGVVYKTSPKYEVTKRY